MRNKNSRKKYIFGVVVITIALLQLSRAKRLKWVCANQHKPNDTQLQHQVCEVRYFDGQKWVEPKYLTTEWFRIPGAYCPSMWQSKWSNVKMSMMHEMNLEFWFRWPSSMVHIALDSNLREPMNSDYFDHALSGIERSIFEISEDFLDDGCKNENAIFKFFINLADSVGRMYPAPKE